MSKTYKEQEDHKAVSKNNGKHIRYRIRKQEELEAKRDREDAIKELQELNKEDYNTREDLY